MNEQASKPRAFTCCVCGADFTATIIKGNPSRPMCLSCVAVEIYVGKFIKVEEEKGEQDATSQQ